MTKRSFILVIIILLSCHLAEAITLPERAAGKPTIFLDENRSYCWQDIARNHNFGDATNSPWYVYVLSEGVKVSERPRRGSSIATLKFMEQFRVAEVSGKYLLLYYDSQVPEGDRLLIPKKIRTKKSTIESNGARSDGYVGWVSSDDLLLWSVCPRTENGVYQKIIVFRNEEDFSTRSASFLTRFFSDASCTQGRGVANALDIYSAFYYAPNGNVLVANILDTKEGKMTTQRVGWIKRGDYIKWNTRICWEPAFHTVTNEGKINDVCNLYSTHRAAYMGDSTQVLSMMTLDGKRKPAIFPRCPVLDYQKGVAELLYTVIFSNEDYGRERNPKNIGGVKVKGYSTMYYDRQSDKQMWTPCIFLAEKELFELIANLSSVTRSNSSNRRGDLQRECLRMILMYTGQQELTDTQLNDPNLGEIIREIEKECGYKFDSDVKAHILNPNKLSDSDFSALCARLKEQVDNLRKQQTNSQNYWTNQGLKYYYIHLDAMPLVEPF